VCGLTTAIQGEGGGVGPTILLSMCSGGGWSLRRTTVISTFSSPARF
jgi:hypothetical protein